MGLIFFNFKSKARQFQYKPRHYDPDAEAREARRRMILGEDYAEGEYKPGMYIRERRLLRLQEQDRLRRERNKQTWLRSIIFLVLALLVLYFMFNYFGQAFGGN